MKENLTKYESLKKQHDILFKFVGNCRYKLSKDKGNLEVKSQYNLFNTQLNQVRKELRLYEKIQKYVKKGEYKQASELSINNPDLKEILSKIDLINLANYYEENFKRFIAKNKNLKLANKSLEKTLGKMEESIDSFKKEGEKEKDEK